MLRLVVADLLFSFGSQFLGYALGDHSRPAINPLEEMVYPAKQKKRLAYVECDRRLAASSLLPATNIRKISWIIPRMGSKGRRLWKSICGK